MSRSNTGLGGGAMSETGLVLMMAVWVVGQAAISAVFMGSQSRQYKRIEELTAALAKEQPQHGEHTGDVGHEERRVAQGVQPLG